MDFVQSVIVSAYNALTFAIIEAMLRFALLGFALVTMCVVMGESEPVLEEVMCEFNGRFFEVGQKTYDGCERCKCRKNGTF